MTGLGAATAAAATLTGAQVLTALVSPLPLLILGGIVVAVWVPIAVLLLTPVWSTCPDRNQRATAMVDRVLAAIPGSRHTTPPTEPTDTDAPTDTDPGTNTDVQPARRRRWPRGRRRT